MAIRRLFRHFSGNALPAEVVAVTAGGGTVTVANSLASFAGAANADAAFIYLADRPLKNANYHVRVCCRTNTAYSSGFLNVVTNAVAPTPDTNANFLLTRVSRFSRGNFGGNDVLALDYWDNTGTRKSWDVGTQAFVTAGTLETTNPPLGLGEFVTCGMEIDGAGQRVRWYAISTAASAAGASEATGGIEMTLLTDWVAVAGLRGGGDNLWVIPGGDFLTDFGAGQTMDIEYVRVTTGAKKVGLVNKRDTSADTYRLIAFHDYADAHDVDNDATGTAGAQAMPVDRTTNAIDVGAGGSWDAGSLRDKSVCLGSNGTWYCAYQGSDAGGASKVGIAHSADGETWAKYAGNPILAPVRNSIFQPELFEITNDAVHRWNIIWIDFENVGSTSRVRWISTPDATPETANWTDNGVILDHGGVGAFDERQASNARVWYEAGQWYLLYSGHTPTVGDWWRWGLAKGPTLLSLVKQNGGAALFDGNGAPATTLTGAMANTVVCPVTSTVGFAPEQLVVLSSDAVQDNGIMMRVRAVTDGTHLELYSAVTIAAGASIMAVYGGSVSTEGVFRLASGGYAIYVSAFGGYNLPGGKVAYFENFGVQTCAALGGAVTTPQLMSPVMPHATFGNRRRSLENPAWAKDPITLSTSTSRPELTRRGRSSRHRLAA